MSIRSQKCKSWRLSDEPWKLDFNQISNFCNRFIPLILIGYEFSDLDVFYNHESYRYLDLGNEFDLGEDSFTVAAMIRLRPDPESSANFTNRGARQRFNFDRKIPLLVGWSSRRRTWPWVLLNRPLKWTRDSWDYEKFNIMIDGLIIELVFEQLQIKKL